MRDGGWVVRERELSFFVCGRSISALLVQLTPHKKNSLFGPEQTVPT